MNPALTNALLNAWAGLHGEYWFFWTLHWRAKGAPYYGDHLLYQRLYEKRQDELDRMAEVISAVAGTQVLDPVKALDAAKPFVQSIESINEPDAVKARIAAQAILSLLDTANTVAKGSPYELSINNVLAGIADNHLEAVYLLQQRAGGQVMMPPPQAASPYIPYGTPNGTAPADYHSPALSPAFTDLGEPDEKKASMFYGVPPLPELPEGLGDLLALIPGGQKIRYAQSAFKGVLAGTAAAALIAVIYWTVQKNRETRAKRMMGAV